MRLQIALAFSVAFGMPGIGHAADICVDLLAQGIRDTSSQQVTESRFNQIKSSVCNSNYDSYAKASSQAINGGFDLPGLFGISAGVATANSDYSTKWSNFCQSNYGVAMANSDLKSYFSTANQAVLHSFDNCVNVTSERFIRYVEPQADGRTFAIVFDNKRQGNASFIIEDLTLTIAGDAKQIKVQDACDFKKDFPYDTKPLNAISIVCRKTASDEVIVNARTTAGNIVPVAVPAVPDPGPSIADRVGGLEGRTAEIKKIEEGLGGSLTQIQSNLKQVNDAISAAAPTYVSSKICFIHSENAGVTYVNTIVPVPQNAPPSVCTGIARQLWGPYPVDGHGRQAFLGCEGSGGPAVGDPQATSAPPGNPCGW